MVTKDMYDDIYADPYTGNTGNTNTANTATKLTPEPTVPFVGREPDQEDILATALYLSQNNRGLYGMTAEMWLSDAKLMRQRVRAITGVYWADEDQMVELYRD